MTKAAILENTKNRIVTCPDLIGVNGLTLVAKAQFGYSVKEPLMPHHHENCMEIVYMDKGCQFYQINGEYSIISGGDLYITQPYELHGSGERPQEKSTIYWLHIDLSPEKNILGLTKDYSDLLKQNLLNISKRVFKGSELIKHYCTEIIDCICETDCFTNDPLCILKIQQAAVGALIEIIELEKKQEIEKSDKQMKEVLSFIESNIKEPIDIPDLAKVCFLSESYFRQKFKKYTGMSPHEYIMRKKIELAQTLITKKWSFVKIAQYINLPSVSYFSYIFKKYSSVTPSEYRRKNTLVQ